MRHSTLSEHLFKKGKFITPMNSIPSIQELSDEKSWTYGRMPDYLWIGLILQQFERNKGLEKLLDIISKLHELAPKLNTARMSEILKLDFFIQQKFYDYIIKIGLKKSFSPLTIFLTSSKAPIFAKNFYCTEENIENRCSLLIETMQKIMNHQSYEATDIRFIALYFNLLSGNIHLLKSQIDSLVMYPLLTHTEEMMRSIRPTIRCLEMMILQFEKTNLEYLQLFWRCISEMTECSTYSVEFPEETRNISSYMENLYEIFSYLSELYISSSPLDEKMKVLLGITTYSYKRMKEAYEHNLFNSISGRSCVRILIENYIMIKYLVKNESSHENIWKDYQLYGLGQYKLILARSRENSVSKESHFDAMYIEALINEFKGEEFIDMDTKYFDKHNIRLKAEVVDEKMLYGLYYDYDSAFEHGLWGAIRESSLLKCDNPAHKYHCVPDIDDINRLKTVLPDCIMIMNKTINFLDELYGIPEELLNEVVNFEIKPIIK